MSSPCSAIVSTSRLSTSVRTLEEEEYEEG
jgi:hypothetical protein